MKKLKHTLLALICCTSLISQAAESDYSALQNFSRDEDNNQFTTYGRLVSGESPENTDMLFIRLVHKKSTYNGIVEITVLYRPDNLYKFPHLKIGTVYQFTLKRTKTASCDMVGIGVEIINAELHVEDYSSSCIIL